jgi:hypothetical protein
MTIDSFLFNASSSAKMKCHLFIFLLAYFLSLLFVKCNSLWMQTSSFVVMVARSVRLSLFHTPASISSLSMVALEIAQILVGTDFLKFSFSFLRGQYHSSLRPAADVVVCRKQTALCLSSSIVSFNNLEKWRRLTTSQQHAPTVECK